MTALDQQYVRGLVDAVLILERLSTGQSSTIELVANDANSFGVIINTPFEPTEKARNLITAVLHAAWPELAGMSFAGHEITRV